MRFRFFRSKSFFIVVATIITLSIAANTGVGWLYLLGCIYLSILLLSFFVPRIWLSKISFERICPSEIFRLNSFRTILIIKNNSRFNIGYIFITDNFLDTLTSLKPVSLKPKQEVRVEYEITAKQRGIFNESSVLLKTGGYFGIFNFSKTSRVMSEVTILPRYMDIMSLPINSYMGSYQRLTATNDVFHRGYLLSGVKEYHPGDELRAIHWRSSAKRNEIILKEFEPETGQNANILINNFINPGNKISDVTTAAFNERFDIMCEIAASVANYLINNGFSLKISTLDNKRNYISHPTFKECLDYLAKIKVKVEAKDNSKDLSFPRKWESTAYPEETLIYIASGDGFVVPSGTQNTLTFICRENDLDKCIKDYTYV